MKMIFFDGKTMFKLVSGIPHKLNIFFPSKIFLLHFILPPQKTKNDLTGPTLKPELIPHYNCGYCNQPLEKYYIAIILSMNH